MPATRSRSRKAVSTTKRDAEPEKARESDIDSAPALPLANPTTGKRNISEVLSGDEGDTLTKELAPTGKVARQRRKRQRSASPVISPKGPRKRTNEHPGLIGKKTRRTKAEVAAEKAAKEAKAKALQVKKAEAMASLATMEMDQESTEAEQRRRIIRRQPSVWDVTTYNASEEFDLGFLGETDDDSDTNSEATLPDATAAAAAFEVSGLTEIDIYWKDLRHPHYRCKRSRGGGNLPSRRRRCN
jgi:hypothetical protein